MRSVKISYRQIAPHQIFHLQFKNNYELCMTFIRLQEFYESHSNLFRNKYFELEEYMDWYARDLGNGNFTYTFDWGGFNVPSHILLNFLKVFKNNLRTWEQDLLNVLTQHKIDMKSKFYLIGTARDADKEAIPHETQHGLFYLYDEYRLEMESIVKKYKLTRLRTALMKQGYNKDVIVDEIQAYLLTSPAKHYKEESTKRLRKELKNATRRFFSKK